MTRARWQNATGFKVAAYLPIPETNVAPERSNQIHAKARKGWRTCVFQNGNLRPEFRGTP